MTVMSRASSVRSLLVTLLVLAGALVSVAPAAAITGVEGQPLSEVELADMRPPCSLPFERCPKPPAEATIKWGDGKTSPGTFTERNCTENTCSLRIAGSHTYELAGSYQGQVSIESNGWKTLSFFTAEIADGKLTITNPSVVRNGNRVSLSAIDIYDEGHQCADTVSLSIDWGDGHIDPVSFAGLRAPGGPPAESSNLEHCDIIQGVEHEYETSDQPSKPPVFTATDSAGQHAELLLTGIAAPVVAFPEEFPLGSTSVGVSSAILEGAINPEGSPITSCRFEWGPSTLLITSGKPCEPDQVGSASIDTSTVSASINGLPPGQPTYFRLVVTTSAGTRGVLGSLTTELPPAPGAPSVLTGGAVAVAKTSATLEGEVDPNGGAVAECFFEWGTSAVYGHTTPCTPSSFSGTGFHPVAAAVPGLEPGTPYHFRLVASNTGSPRTYGADGAFTTLPSCSVEIQLLDATAVGCFRHPGSTYVSLPGTAMTIDGLTLTPDDATGTITVDPAQNSVAGSGRVQVKASEMLLADERLAWRLQAGSDGKTSALALTTPAHTVIGGFPVGGSYALNFNPDKSSDIKGTVGLPFLAVLYSTLIEAPVNGAIELHTDRGSGLQREAITISRPNVTSHAVEFKDMHVTYHPREDTWEGGGELVLPTPQKLTVRAKLVLLHGGFHEISTSATGLHVPIGPGIFAEEVSSRLALDPFSLGGGFGVAFGPSGFKDGTLARVNGTFAYAAPVGTAPGHLAIAGKTYFIGIPTNSGQFDYYTDGLARFKTSIGLGLPDPYASVPQHQPVYFETAVAGDLYEGKFDIEAKTRLHLNFIGLETEATLLISDVGLAACAHLEANFGLFSVSWSPGFGYTWASHSLDLMARKCSVGAWKTLSLPPGATAASQGRRLPLKHGASLVALTGSTGAPKVTLQGPGGQAVSVPLSSTKPFVARGFVVFQDPVDKVTYIAVQRGGGIWHWTLEAGSSPVSGIRDAELLPEPSVHAQVFGRGRRRVLSWHLKPMTGQRVVFWEEGPDSAKVVATTSRSSGQRPFTVASGSGGRRTIVAQVISFGLPRKDIKVTRFVAPSLQRPGRISRVRVVLHGNRALVTWTAAANAQRYVVAVTTSDGAHLVESAGAGARSLTIHYVVPIKAAAVKVLATVNETLLGPVTTARAIAGKAHSPKLHR